MSISQYFKLILGVLKDFRVIITVILMVLIIEFAKFITTYRKKPPKPKVKKVAAPKEEKPKEEASAEENAEEDSESE